MPVNLSSLLPSALLFLARLAACAGLVLAAPVQATSFGRAPPHDPVLACMALTDLVRGIGQGVLPVEGLARDVRLLPESEDAGASPAGRAAAVAALRTANGKPDRVPVRLGRIVVLGQDGAEALYAVELIRESWTLVSYEDDAMMLPRAVPDPHWEQKSSTWLAAFRSSNLTSLREAPELWPLLRSGKPAPGCWADLP